MEKSVLEMIGGEKHINPHYDIKAESSSCYHSSEGFTGIEINGVRFSNIREMLIYMNKQRGQLSKAKDHIKQLLDCLKQDTNDPETNYYVCQYMDKAEQFLRENEQK
jgi:hypothetical protein